MFKVTGFLAALFLAAATYAQDDSGVLVTEDDPAQPLALAQVPAIVKTSAKAAAPDVYFSKAEQQLWRDQIVYRLSGTLFRYDWDVYVRNDGTVMDVQKGFRDDD